MTVLPYSRYSGRQRTGFRQILLLGESRRTGFRATAGEGAYLRRRSAVAQGGVCDRTRSRYQSPLYGFSPEGAYYCRRSVARGGVCDRARSPYQPRYMPSPSKGKASRPRAQPLGRRYVPSQHKGKAYRPYAFPSRKRHKRRPPRRPPTFMPLFFPYEI